AKRALQVRSLCGRKTFRRHQDSETQIPCCRAHFATQRSMANTTVAATSRKFARQRPAIRRAREISRSREACPQNPRCADAWDSIYRTRQRTARLSVAALTAGLLFV